MEIQTYPKDINIDITAYHEAAHAVVALYFGWNIQIVSVDFDNPGNGHTLMSPVVSIKKDISNLKQIDALIFWKQYLKEQENRACIKFAGALAEAKILSTPMRSLGARSDFESILKILYELDSTRKKLRQLIHIPLDYRKGFDTRLRVKTRRLISQPQIWKAICNLADELIIWRTLDGGDVAETVQWTLGPPNQFIFHFSQSNNIRSDKELSRVHY